MSSSYDSSIHTGSAVKVDSQLLLTGADTSLGGLSWAVAPLPT